jgi:UDP-GlcNAc3NAcA epimerase
MLKILTVVGARPQFVKAAAVSKAIADRNAQASSPLLREEIIHTGQHYDDNMSAIFFSQLGLPAPAANLSLGGGSHGEMTGRMLIALEKELVSRRPDWVLIYGDTNSTLAGALAAVKLGMPVAHVEAGLRSFNRAMPEEINRILADRISRLLFCPTRIAVQHLAAEGMSAGVFHVGDVMYDAAKTFGAIADRDSDILSRLALKPGKYFLATVHRQENTDDPARLEAILSALSELEGAVVLPLHPRTRKTVESSSLKKLLLNIITVDPVPFLDMIALEKHAKVILTDSGGVQKEAYFHGVPCVTLRDETEWTETVDAGWNVLAGADREKIICAAANAKTGSLIEDYGAGDAAGKIIDLLLQA